MGSSDDPLVEVPSGLDPRIPYDALPLPPRGAPLLRREVVSRLLAAVDDLPEGFGLTVLDGWRSRAFQGALLAYYRGQQPALAEGYVSDPADADVVAPHTTGGAVDLTLSWHGTPLALGTAFDAFEATAHLTAFEPVHMDPTVRALRRLLAHHLRAAGFAPYPWEWWHWSFGDQWWAADQGETTSLFPAVDAPPGGAS